MKLRYNHSIINLDNYDQVKLFKCLFKEGFVIEAVKMTAGADYLAERQQHPPRLLISTNLKMLEKL